MNWTCEERPEELALGPIRYVGHANMAYMVLFLNALQCVSQIGNPNFSGYTYEQQWSKPVYTALMWLNIKLVCNVC